MRLSFSVYLQITGVDVSNEARGSVKFHASVSKSVLSTGEITVFLGPGDSNIKETAFLLQTSKTITAHR